MVLKVFWLEYLDYPIFCKVGEKKKIERERERERTGKCKALFSRKHNKVIIPINAPALYNAPLYRPKIELTPPSILHPRFAY